MLINDQLPVNPKRALILGCGLFGSSAAEKIYEQWPGCETHVTDKTVIIPEYIPGEHHSGTDGIQFLADMLQESRPADIVVPCVPVHVVFEWVLLHFGFSIPVPIQLMEILPGAIAGKDGCIYSSLSDFICPANCSEPEGCCPESREKRINPLFSTMEKISIQNYSAIVVRSNQLLPGVGAFTASQLYTLINEVRKKKGRFLIGTASRCHGVLNGFIH